MLVKCKACGKEISKLADKCPDCGHPNKTPDEKRKETTSLITGVIFLALIAWWFWPSSKDKDVSATEMKQERASVNAKEKMLWECEQLVLPMITDRSSYNRFGQSSYVVGQEGYYSIKLNFSAKNSFGQSIDHQAVCKYDNETKTIELLRAGEK